jgi:hydroxymethylpyrimidine/phosphomethylpyrimidine kinase
MTGRVLSVAESDACGTSGAQADVKTVLALGGYAATAISALTVQDRAGGFEIKTLDAAFIAKQMRAAMSEIGMDAVKVGFLPDAASVNAVADVLDEMQNSGIPVVVDPSIVARGGVVLVDEAAIAAWKRRLYVRTTVLTPNLREAEILTGMHIRDVDDMRHAAAMMRTLGVENVLLKTGPGAAPGKVLYFVAGEDGETVFERDAVDKRSTLGAGATLSAGIATGLAQGMALYDATERALSFMHQAIVSAHDEGGRAGPMNHAFDIETHCALFTPRHVRVRSV